MLGKKGNIYSYKYDEEMFFKPLRAHGKPCEQGKSMCNTCKNAKDGSHREDIVEVSYDVVGIV